MSIDFLLSSREVKVEPDAEENKIAPKYGPFDYTNSINSGRDLFVDAESVDEVEKNYNAWLANKSLSYFADTLPYVSLMNTNYHLDKKMQYHFLLHIIKPRVRRSKWAKKEKMDDVDFIKKTFGYSQKKAESAVMLLSALQLEQLKKGKETGGVKGRK